MNNLEHEILVFWKQMHNTSAELVKDGLKPFPSAYKPQVKRSSGLEDILLTRPFQKLYSALFGNDVDEDRMTFAAVAVAVLAEIKDRHTDSLPTVAGKSVPGGDKAVVSELRFAKLLASKSADDLVRNLRRTIRLCKGKANPVTLVCDIELWLKEIDPKNSVNRPRTVLNWAMQYYT